MRKKPAATGPDSDPLFLKIADILEAARQSACRSVNFSMVSAYWRIGQLIVENEQGGKARAAYGKSVLREVASRLTQDFGRGFDERELRRMRQFYLAYPIRDAVRPELSWTHYRLLLRVENESARRFYEQEALGQNWSSRALARQINSFYHERLLASQDRGLVKAEAEDNTKPLAMRPQDYLRDPIVLEFLGLPQDAAYRERDLESALITHIQAFLLELGKGFAFVARQQHIRTENSDFFVDLVFYHYHLRCFVLIDLKTSELTHQDVGQMDMYVRMYDDLKRQEGDNPTIGIILCSEKDGAVVKYSVLAEGKNLFASRYRLYLPTEGELKALLERDRHLLDASGSAVPSSENGEGA